MDKHTSRFYLIHLFQVSINVGHQLILVIKKYQLVQKKTMILVAPVKQDTNRELLANCVKVKYLYKTLFKIANIQI